MDASATWYSTTSSSCVDHSSSPSIPPQDFSSDHSQPLHFHQHSQATVGTPELGTHPSYNPPLSRYDLTRRGAPTSDLRGTLAIASSPEKGTNQLEYNPVDDEDRRDSEPFPFAFSSNSHSQSYSLYTSHRASYPLAPAESSYRRLIARLPREQPLLTSSPREQNYEPTSSGPQTPSLTEGSTSSSLSRSSSSTDGCQWYPRQIDAGVEDARYLAESPVIHDSSAYPFPTGYHPSPALGLMSPTHSYQSDSSEWRKRRASFSEESSVDSPRVGLSHFTLRPSPSIESGNGRFPSPQLRGGELSRSLGPSSPSSQIFHQPQSPRGSVYELSEDNLGRSQNRHHQAHYSPIDLHPHKQRRMSFADDQTTPLVSPPPFLRRESLPATYGSSGITRPSSSSCASTFGCCSGHATPLPPTPEPHHIFDHFHSPVDPARTPRSRRSPGYSSPFLDPANSPPYYQDSPPPPLSDEEPTICSPARPDSYPGADVSAIHRPPPTNNFTPSADVRKQKLRFEEDFYTPLWVRFSGHQREGWCALCPGDGKWLQLKNSAFWYHRQFQHGVSSVSGHYFLPPLETRPSSSGDKIEGLCHSCGDWVPYNSKGGGRGPTLWYRHSHSCHAYFSPKREATKRIRMLTQNTGGHGSKR